MYNQTVGPGPSHHLKLFGVDITRESYGHMAALSGEIDVSTVDDVEEKLRDAIDGHTPVLALDLRKVTFMDSSGLRLALQLDKEQGEAGGRLVVVRGIRRVERVFELTRADERLEMVSDPSEIS